MLTKALSGGPKMTEIPLSFYNAYFFGVRDLPWSLQNEKQVSKFFSYIIGGWKAEFRLRLKKNLFPASKTSSMLVNEIMGITSFISDVVRYVKIMRSSY